MGRAGLSTVWGGVLLLVAGCGSAPDQPIEADAKAASEAANDGRVACALDGAEAYDRSCTIEEMTSADGMVLIIGRSDVGYRRLMITTDGRGVVSADGSEPAKVSIIGDGLIEVSVGTDRYRLPATVGSAG